jgi:hypothetical protein
MAGDEWIRNALQSSLLKINIRAANFRKFYIEQGRVWFKLRFRNVPNFDRSIGCGDDCDARHELEGKGKKEKGEVCPPVSGGKDVRFEIAALPPHSAESLRLSGQSLVDQAARLSLAAIKKKSFHR